jgi:DnaJ-domain-containing protein 1
MQIYSTLLSQEMLKHHPDVQSNSSEKEKRRATERSKLITDAYRKIKATQKI